MRMRSRLWCGIAVAFMLAVDGAMLPAQVEPLLGKITDFGIYPVIPVNRSDNNFAKTGVGVEFAFSIGEYTRKMSASDRMTKCAKLKADAQANPNEIKTQLCNVAGDAIITTTLKEVHRRPESKDRDSVLSVETEPLRDRLILFEIAVANQQIPLSKRNTGPDWSLTGQIEEFPSVSLYSTFGPDWPVSPYVGARYVVGDLKGVKILQSDSTSTVDGSTFGFGGAFGVVGEIGDFNLFAEVSGSSLHFDTSHWKVPANLSPQPASYPTKLDVHGIRFSVGVQLAIGGEKE